MTSTAEKTSTSTDLAALQEAIKRELATMKDAVAPPSGYNISTAGKVFKMPNGETHQGPIQAVILDFRNFNRYYTKAYNPQDPQPPECFAIAKNIHEMAPHEKALSPQADKCAECTFNQWGSAPTGRGKACRNTVRLAIASPDATPDSEAYLLTVSPTGLRSWSALVNKLDSHGMLPVQVVTEISFDPNHPYPTLLFKALEAHDRLDVFWKLREDAQSLLDAPPSANG